MTRQAYAHEALLDLDPDGDDAAPGGAITVALCGNWTHDPPCPLAPHHTRAHRSGNEVTLRLLFAAEPEEEPKVRALVEERPSWAIVIRSFTNKGLLPMPDGVLLDDVLS